MALKTEICNTCLGTGKVKNIFEIEVLCPACKGIGKVTVDDNK